MSDLALRRLAAGLFMVGNYFLAEVFAFCYP